MTEVAALPLVTRSLAASTAAMNCPIWRGVVSCSPELNPRTSSAVGVVPPYSGADPNAEHSEPATAGGGARSRAAPIARAALDAMRRAGIGPPRKGFAGTGRPVDLIVWPDGGGVQSVHPFVICHDGQVSELSPTEPDAGSR